MNKCLLLNHCLDIINNKRNYIDILHTKGNQVKELKIFFRKLTATITLFTIKDRNDHNNS